MHKNGVALLAKSQEEFLNEDIQKYIKSVRFGKVFRNVNNDDFNDDEGSAVLFDNNPKVSLLPQGFSQTSLCQCNSYFSICGKN